MIRRNNLEGKIYGKWTVSSFSHLNKSRSAFWNCTCICGNTSIIPANNLRKGTSTQCQPCSRKQKTSVYSQGNKKKYIYIFKLNEYYKIGVTNDWKKRLSQIQRNSPYLVSMVFISTNSPQLEERIHQEYSKSCIRGEWFLLTEEEVNSVIIKLKKINPLGLISDALGGLGE